MKSIMAVSVLVASALATPVAYAAGTPYRYAGPTWYIDISPGSSTGYCTASDAYLNATSDNSALQVSGDVIRLTKHGTSCPDVENYIPGAYPTAPVQYVISYVLYFWNGSNAVLCGTNPGYPGWEEPAATKSWVPLTNTNYLGQLTNGVTISGCGPGYYFVGIQAYYHDSIGWEGGIVYTDWAYFNLPPETVVK